MTERFNLNVTLPPDLVEAIASRAASIALEHLHSRENSPRYLTLAEAARYLRWPRGRLYKLTAARAIPHIKHGGRILFQRDELDAWLDEYREGPRPSRHDIGMPRLPNRNR